MCGRFVLAESLSEIARLLGVDLSEDIAPRYNIAPTQPILMVRMGPAGREATHMRWGFIPAWAKEPGVKPLLQARAETIAEKPSFRAAFRRRRCLIPANGFYEWGIRDGAKRSFYVQRRDRDLFAFAGVWETWAGADGSEIDTIAVVTTQAQGEIADIHHRAPVAIPEDAFSVWLETPEQQAEMVTSLLAPAAPSAWCATEVGSQVNSVRNDGPSLIAPATAAARQQDLFA